MSTLDTKIVSVIPNDMADISISQGNCNIYILCVITTGGHRSRRFPVHDRIYNTTKTQKILSLDYNAQHSFLLSSNSCFMSGSERAAVGMRLINILSRQCSDNSATHAHSPYKTQTQAHTETLSINYYIQTI